MSRFVAVVIISVVLVGNALALDGAGTQGDPWRITSLADFNDFASDANYWDDYSRLDTDVNLAGRVYERAVIAWDVENVGSDFDGIAFTGVFDGADYKILNLTIDTAGAKNDYLGLIGHIDMVSQVKNLGVESSSVTGGYDSWHLGGLCGSNDGIISNCYANGAVSIGWAELGGLCGSNGGTISNCYANGSVSGNYSVGGLCGETGYNRGSINKCYSTATVTGHQSVGGLCGYNNVSTIINCYSMGSVIGGVDSANIGGLCGKSRYHSISKCYATGSVSGTRWVGGLCGYNMWSSISMCFWDTETSGEPNMCGNEEDCNNSYGKTTTEMKHQSTFTDWDFINVWNIGENQTYPYLRTHSAGDLNKDGVVNFLDVAITAEQWMNEE